MIARELSYSLLHETTTACSFRSNTGSNQPVAYNRFLHLQDKRIQEKQLQNKNQQWE